MQYNITANTIFEDNIITRKRRLMTCEYVTVCILYIQLRRHIKQK